MQLVPHDSSLPVTAQLKTEVEDKLSRARSNLLLNNPFFGVLALRMELKADTNIEVAKCNANELRYNPRAMTKLARHSLIYIQAHELMHIVLQHHIRMQDSNTYDPKRVARAQDYAVNGLLLNDGFQHPGEPFRPLYDPKYDGMTAEKIYRLLEDEDKNKYQEQLNQENTQAQMGTCSPDPSQGNDNGDAPPPPPTNEEIEQMEQEVKEMVAEAAQAAKMHGKLPGSLSELIEKLLKPKIDWKNQLNRFFTEKIKEDHTWSRPNRRFVHQGLYLPTQNEKTVGEVVIAIDTSCSVSKQEFQIFLTELNSVLEQCTPSKITIIQCDTKITSVEEFTHEDLPIALNMKGRGGTRFNPPFKYVKDNDLNPACFLYFTDMYCSFPEEPDYPVLWLSTSDITEAPWGEVITYDVSED